MRLRRLEEAKKEKMKPKKETKDVFNDLITQHQNAKEMSAFELLSFC